MHSLLEDFWDYLKSTKNRIANHISDFWVVWLLLSALLICSYLYDFPRWGIYLIAILFVLYLLRKPMAMVYSLVGGSASIRSFLFNFLLISLLFAFVYYGLFFRNAGMCFSGDNSRIDYSIFEGIKDRNTIVVRDTIQTSFIEERVLDSTLVSQCVVQKRIEELEYKRVTLGIVIENTLITSLTQDPSDFFYLISDLGESMNAISSDANITRLFSYILLLHILISWLFLGVFISLVYSKFRYEA